jgi:hypothetical protein
MNRTARLLLCSLIRSSTLVFLLLCLIAQPVLAAWGDMHEFTAHTDAAGIDLNHRSLDAEIAQHAVGHAADDVPAGNDADDPIHVLSHHAHCCSQPQWPFVSQLTLPLSQPSSTRPWPAEIPAVAASHIATPFRPPILD